MQPQPHAPTPPEVAVTGRLISLDDAAATEPGTCGQKAATLARLRQAGHRVPDGYVLSPEVARAPGPEVVAEALRALGGPVAVRSSALAEDLPQASWAGQYETVLGVEGLEAVLAAVARVVASASSARARAYGTAGEVAVLLQRMVPADAAGVAFSANPVTGARDEVVLSAVAGLAEGLVGGEVEGESWTVREAAEVAGEARVLRPEQALAVAGLARRLEAEEGAPQDVEWALVGEELVLLQARPVTALPVEPEIVAPEEGVWLKDAAHFSGPVTPFGASVYLPHFDSATREMCATWGLMVDHVDCAVIGHEVYSRAVPFGGGSETAAPPPWWLLGIVSRLHPGIRGRLALGRAALEADLLRQIPREWREGGRAALVAELARLRAVDLPGLDEAALEAHTEALMAFVGRCQHLHFRLFLPYVVGVHGLSAACEELLGWDTAQAMELMQGLSEASSAPSRDLARLAERLRADPAARRCVEEEADWQQHLPEVSPGAAAAVAAWLEEHGLRTVEYDPGSPTLAERADLFGRLLRDALAAAEEGRSAELEAARQARVAEARGQLSGAALARFDEALALAELVYPLREDNVVLTDNMPSALLRRLGLELGRRLVAAGRLDRAEQAMMLSLEELRAARADSGQELRERVQRRQAELAWVRANPGPDRYGPEPGAPPDLRGLVPSARRLNGAMIWMMGLELVPPAAGGEGELTGIGACAGTYRGRVRVITDPARLHTLRRGEVLVCPVTTPAWSVVFGQAGALVTDGGSVLSHAAIVAREHALPCVVGTGDATRRLRDGVEVTVDGARGTVTVHG